MNTIMKADLNELVSLQDISLRHRQSIAIIDTDNSPVSSGALASFLKQLMTFGYGLDLTNTSVLTAIQKGHLSQAVIESVLSNLDAQTSLSGKVFYPQFPLQTAHKDNLELTIDAIIYAITDFNVLPENDTTLARQVEIYQSQKQLTLLSVVDPQDLKDLFWSLLTRKTAPSKTIKEDLAWLLHIFEETLVQGIDLNAINIPFKELMVWAVINFKHYNIDLVDLIKTPTDLLRICQYDAEGKCDLLGRFKLNRPNTAFKTFINTALMRLPFNPEDILRYKEEWKFLFRYMAHWPCTKQYAPYLYREKVYQNFYAKEDCLYQALVNDKSGILFNNQESVSDDLVNYLTFMSNRPSELLRRVDKLVRLELNTKELSLLCETLTKTAAKSEPRVVYQLLAHLKRRSHERLVKVGHSVLFLEAHDPFSKRTAGSLEQALKQGLIDYYKTRDNSSPVFIKKHPYYKHTMVSTSERQSNKSFNGLTVGSRLPFDQDYIRLFTSWTHKPYDIDLSASILDKDFNIKDICAFYSLNTENMIHSGDIRKGPGQEFIDINIQGAKKDGAAYIYVSLHNYTGTSFKGVKAGLQILEEGNRQKGSIYKPEEALISSELSAESSTVYAFVIDLLNNELVWIDAPSTKYLYTNYLNDKQSANRLLKFHLIPTISLKEALDLLEQAGQIQWLEDDQELLEDQEVLELTAQNSDGQILLYHDKINNLLMK